MVCFEPGPCTGGDSLNKVQGPGSQGGPGGPPPPKKGEEKKKKKKKRKKKEKKGKKGERKGKAMILHLKQLCS